MMNTIKYGRRAGGGTKCALSSLGGGPPLLVRPPSLGGVPPPRVAAPPPPLATPLLLSKMGQLDKPWLSQWIVAACSNSNIRRSRLTHEIGFCYRYINSQNNDLFQSLAGASVLQSVQNIFTGRNWRHPVDFAFYACILKNWWENVVETIWLG